MEQQSVPSVDVDFSNLQYFLSFIGHGRSGHSLIASLIDAHQFAVCTHEMFILQYMGQLENPEQLYQGIADVAAQQAENGRFKETSVYEYFIDYEWQGKSEQPTIIGDKCGGNMSFNYRKRPWLLHQLMKFVPLPMKWLHVVRNPYDNIATLSQRNEWPLEYTIDYYMEDEQAIELFAQREQPEILTLHLENFILNTKQELAEIAQFLELEPHPQWMDACAQLVYDKPHQTRNQVDWPPMQLQRIQRHIENTSYLEGYSYG